MMTVKYRDNRGNEMIQPSVIHTSWHDGALTATVDEGGTVTFGPNFIGNGGQTPVAFVMNEAGATVARYDFFPQPMPEELRREVEGELAQAA